ncbi:hypothetical protein LTR91_025132 [Friedmanniomyces endolithicus]|uniref:Phosphatidate phosphatase APP1 catalytic domain-containing protein n=1 Tax=Friedmanniomyces endolithicus TaxID=329885 RepID=A0AAN6H3G1_9PEZI|nr:hypothetical protein LTR57_018237 [Friedmanniomyces endolithicus]KAK0951210.1 hypothetical protein LTR91_025132 [Friedmanniomyces endolithicus]KAK0955902.1 hypothetical protein LTS01_023133 [Friedmanniomyces endolithicus]KAK1028086.1 hypothetical protein LTS16_020934 [Friedmanniomyces endolithicus]
MAAYTGPGKSVVYDGVSGEPVGQGSRRKRMAGYLKAANEMRQSYFGGEVGTGREGYEDPSSEGGAFPDAAVVRSGNEEMILFPSYARKHVKSKMFSDTPNPRSEQDYWQREWDKHRDDNAIVDVDVRGWVYVPHKGPHTRKQRLAMGALRQFAGIPSAPATKRSDSLATSRASSRSTSPERLSKQEEELVNIEAEKIARRGEAEQRNAQRGVYSEDPSKATDTDSVYGGNSRSSSPDPRGRDYGLSRVDTLSLQDDDSPPMQALQKRTSWSLPSKMSAAELTVANTHLLQRAKPFMHMGLQESPIKLFFFNDKDSRQLTVFTESSGHFTCRAALDFVPTHVRVMATDKLSSTEEVQITEPRGVSVISDIDDTVKHSAISAGVAEVVRNAFIRDLGDLTIEGVREWYTTMHDMGVQVHYVSNSPWQMYPILTSYFKMARLPMGTVHLKHYTGLLSGIFEPVAERKKSSIDKILRDFPDRKFILIGDSGVADLEVYTDTAMENPGRVIGIFIRDVTTPVKTGYFDSSSMGGLGGESKHSRNHSRHRSGDSLAASKPLSRPDDIRNDDADLEAAVAASLTDMQRETRRARSGINPDAPALEPYDGANGRRPKPPPPRRSRTAERVGTEESLTASPEHEDLIDFSEPVARSSRLEPSAAAHSKGHTPSPPPKPRALRSPSPNSQATPTAEKNGFKLPPPRPRKPSSTVKPLSAIPPQLDGSTPQPPPAPIQSPSPNIPPPATLQTHQPSPLSQVTRQDSPVNIQPRPPLPSRPRTVQRLAGAASSYWHGSQSSTSAEQPPRLPTTAPTKRHLEPTRTLSSSTSSTTRSADDLRTHHHDPHPTPRTGTLPPPLPVRRNHSSYPFSTSSRSATKRLSGGWDGDDSGNSMPPSPGLGPVEAGMGKKEYLWVQRLAKAKRELEPRGVTVRTWRVGADVADICVRLAEMEFRRVERETRASGKEGVR